MPQKDEWTIKDDEKNNKIQLILHYLLKNVHKCKFLYGGESFSKYNLQIKSYFFGLFTKNIKIELTCNGFLTINGEDICNLKQEEKFADIINSLQAIRDIAEKDIKTEIDKIYNKIFGI